MNTKAILFIMLMMGLSPVMQVTASVNSVYKYIKNIVEDTLADKDDYRRLINVKKALDKVRMYKKSIQDDITYLHMKEDTLEIRPVILSVLLMSFGVKFGTQAFHFYSQGRIAKGHEGVVLCSMMMSLALALPYYKNISIYFKKKSIEELNAVITKLEVTETELRNKLALKT